MTYEKAVASKIALEEIKNGRDIEKNLLILEEHIGPILEREFDKEEKRKRNVETSYMQYEPIAEICRVIHAMSNGKKYFAVAANELRIRENETQDLLHVLELADEPEDVLLDRAKDIAQIRRDRRTAKNFQELIKPFYAFITKNPKILDELKKVHSEMVRLDNNMKIRQYTPKERTALEMAFNKATERMMTDE